MVDQYGRPTVDDGMNLARGLMQLESGMKAEKEKADQKKIESEAYKGLDMLSKNPKADLSGLSDKGRYMASKLFYDKRLSGINAQIKEKQLTNEGMQEVLNRARVQEAMDLQDKKNAMAAWAAGDTEKYKKFAHQIMNRAPNGLNVEMGENGKIKKTSFDGTMEEVDDIPIEQYHEMMGAYFNMSPEDRIKARIANSQIIQQKNQEIYSKAEPMFKGGSVIYKIPAGLVDPVTGKQRGEFYIRDLDDKEKPLTDEERKGYKRMSKEARDYFETTGEVATGNNAQVLAGTREKMKEPTAGTPSNLEKEATFVSKTYNIPPDQALDMLRRDSKFNSIYNAYQKELQTAVDSEGLYGDELNKKDQQLRERYKIDEMVKEAIGNTKERLSQEKETTKTSGSWKQYLPTGM